MSRYVLRYHASDFSLAPGAVIVIGRDPQCEICLDDPVASRRHAKLTVGKDVIWLEDLGSRNGVHINGERVRGKARLNPGDWFRIGRNEFGLRQAQTARPSSPAVSGGGRPTSIPMATVELNLAELWKTPQPPSAEFEVMPLTKLEAQASPVALILDNGRKWLYDRASSVFERFSSSLDMVELLARASAHDEARILLREAIGVLEEHDALGVLPPSTAGRARERIRLWSNGASDEQWQRHLTILDRAEGLPDETDTSSGHTQARNMARVALELDLRTAIDGEKLLVYYQPIIELATGRIVSFEALSRWPHPDRGMVSPAKFIPIAEETGLITQLGDQVLREACLTLRRWRSLYPGLTMSVNLSSVQFQRPDLVQHVERTLREVALEPGALTLELTESSLMKDARSAASMLLQLRALGISISVDDFGTGYSSLSYLHQFPISNLKIDRTFVANLGTDRQSTEIVRTIVTLAHTLNLAAVAEGVETQDQLDRLRSMRCDYAQGFLMARPIEASQIEELLATQPRW